MVHDQYATKVRNKILHHLRGSKTFIEEHHADIANLGANSLQLTMTRTGSFELTDDAAKKFLDRVRSERPGWTVEKHRLAPADPRADGINCFSQSQLSSMSPEDKIKLGNRLGELMQGTDGLWRPRPKVTAE